jgi:iron complex transport system substrate-binding protein
LVGSPYKDSWWIPGGNSYLANLIADAGGDYLGKENPSNESYVISFEHALTFADEADVWINMGNLASKNEILSTDDVLKILVFLKTGNSSII